MEVPTALPAQDPDFARSIGIRMLCSIGHQLIDEESKRYGFVG
jgi:hypothetical protein